MHARTREQNLPNAHCGAVLGGVEWWYEQISDVHCPTTDRLVLTDVGFEQSIPIFNPTVRPTAREI